MAAPKLRAVTDARRAVLYLRQSTHREESISLELQEHEGRAYCERRGYDVVAVEADPGISGRTWNRPAVQRVMEMIERGDADVIVLWKWSRLSRRRLDWAVAADKVETAGGRIESATEPLDTTTSAGRLARGMLTEFAAFESERIGDGWREAHARRIRNGLPANGKPRFGYTYSRETGFTPDPATGPVLANLYRRYIAGESIYSLVKMLHEQGIRPVSGYGPTSDGLWTDRTLRRVLDSGFGAGFITAGGEQHPGRHEPVITDLEWTAFRDARQRRRRNGRVERSEYLLSGLVRCACGSPMNAGQYGERRERKYRCRDAHSKRTHAGGYITAAFVEEEVRVWLAEYAEELNAIARAAGTRPRPTRVLDPTAALRARIDRADARIDKLGLQAIETDMPADSYNRLLAALTAEKAAAQLALDAMEVRVATPALAIAPNLLANWTRYPIPQRRELLRRLIRYIEVTPGRPRGTVKVFPVETRPHSPV